MFLKQWADSNVRNVKDIALMLENNSEFTEEMMFSSLQKITSGIPGLNNPIRALEIERTGQYRDTKGKLIASEVSLRQQLLIATGMGFGERKDFWDAKQANWNQYQAVTDYMDKNAQRLASLYRTDPKSASKMMDEVALEITQVNPLLIRPFLRKFQGKLQEQFADEATLSLHRDFTNMMGSIPDRELREIYNIEKE